MKKVLLIEDDPVVAHVYRSSLEKLHYNTETCADGQSGLQRAQEYRPDAILLDLMLPKMNGIDLLKQIRNQQEFGALPVIVLTNAYIPNMIQEAFAARASQVFNKATITPQHILDALDQLLNGGKALMTPIPVMATPPPMPRDRRASPPPPSNHGHNDYTHQTGPAPAPVRPTVFQEEIRKAFIDAHTGTLVNLRTLVQNVSNAADDQAREPSLVELYRKIHGFTGSAGLAGFADIAQMACVLEVLLKELIEQPKTVNASTLQTVAFSVDFIGDLFKQSRGASELPLSKILIVDDECLARRAIIYSLKKAHLNFEAMDVEDPTVALRLSREKHFDMIFLDVQMPSLDGFELCSKIRELPLNKNTPIIFVTALSDFKSRIQSTLSGGSDLIAKPFLFVELALKVITILIRNRLESKRDGT